MPIMARTRGVAISGIVLGIAGAVVTAVLLASGPTSSVMPATSPSPTQAGDMAGMNHGSAAMPASSPTPTASADSPWASHDHGGTSSHDAGSAAMPTGSPSPTSSADSPWATHDDSGTGSHDHGPGVIPGMDPTTPPDRPLAPVMGVFGGGTSAVLVSAVVLRRRDRARSQARQAARTARAQK